MGRTVFPYPICEIKRPGKYRPAANSASINSFSVHARFWLSTIQQNNMFRRYAQHFRQAHRCLILRRPPPQVRCTLFLSDVSKKYPVFKRFFLICTERLILSSSRRIYCAIMVDLERSSRLSSSRRIYCAMLQLLYLYFPSRILTVSRIIADMTRFTITQNNA